MFKIIRISLVFCYLLILTSCSSEKNNTISIKKDNPILVYKLAVKDLQEKKFKEASLNFENLVRFYPLSNEGIQSQIMLGYIDYLKMEYTQAIYKFEKVIKLYPSHENIDYVYYMKALTYYEQIENENLDGQFNQLSLESFNEVINRFPNSKYTKDSYQKIVAVNENIAAKNMNVAMFYLDNKKYLAAMKRYNIILNEHAKSKFVPEALYRLVEIYYTLGLTEDAKNTAAVIGYNYPTSKWYRYSYDIVNQTKTNTRFSFKKKITSFFNNEK